MRPAESFSFPAIAGDDDVHVIRTPFGTLRHRRKGEVTFQPSLIVRKGLRVTGSLSGGARLLAGAAIRRGPPRPHPFDL